VPGTGVGVPPPPPEPPPLLAQPVSIAPIAIGISTMQAVTAKRTARMRLAGLCIQANIIAMHRSRLTTATGKSRIEVGESPKQAAAREAEEETGWRPGQLRLLVASQPSNGSIDTVHYIFHAEAAERVGEPADISEAERVEWVPLSEVASLIAKGKIVSGPTLIGLLLIGAQPG